MQNDLENNIVNIDVNINNEEKKTADDESNNSSGNYDIIDSKTLRKDIMINNIYPAYKYEIENGLQNIKKWGKIANFLFSTTFIITLISMLISFGAGEFKSISYLSYLAGAINMMSLCSDRFAHYCASRCSSETKKVNILIKSIGINDEIPDTTMISFGDRVTKKE